VIVRNGALKRLSHEAEARIGWVNPTADAGIALADGDFYGPSGIRPMRIERLRALGGPYTEEDRARLLYDEHRDVAKVAALMGKPEFWVRDVCAWDIAQHRSA